MHVLSKYKLSSHRQAVEQGRYSRIDSARRTCQFCSPNTIEDEYHFVLLYPKYARFRNIYIKKYYWTSPFVFKLVQLFSLNTSNRKQLRNLAIFFRKATFALLSYDCVRSLPFPLMSYDCVRHLLFSSPEPKSRVSYCHSAPSVVRP